MCPDCTRIVLKIKYMSDQAIKNLLKADFFFVKLKSLLQLILRTCLLINGMDQTGLYNLSNGRG